MNNSFKIAVFALMAAFGALARQLHVKDKDNPVQIVSFVSGCLIAAFMGTIIFFITDSMDNVNINIAYAAAGISGWIGPQVMDFMSEVVMDKFGMKIKKETAGQDDHPAK